MHVCGDLMAAAVVRRGRKLFFLANILSEFLISVGREAGAFKFSASLQHLYFYHHRLVIPSKLGIMYLCTSPLNVIGSEHVQ